MKSQKCFFTKLQCKYSTFKLFTGSFFSGYASYCKKANEYIADLKKCPMDEQRSAT